VYPDEQTFRLFVGMSNVPTTDVMLSYLINLALRCDNRRAETMQNQRFVVLRIALGTFILVGFAGAYAQLKAA
jgi:hypothetical protein